MSRPPIAPVAWRPPAAPARAREKSGATPFRVDRVVETGAGPEDVAVDAEGRLLTGLADGRILRLAPDGGGRPEQVADTGGRPYGIEVLPDGALVVCDGLRGLLRVDLADGSVDVLVDRVDGAAMRACNNAAVAGDGTIWFTDSSQRFDIADWMGDLLEHSGTGRLLRRTPDGTVDVVVDGLQFPNGVALPPDESYVAVAETGGYRVTRHWLTGPKTGTTDALAENLPGIPDNVSTGSDGRIWVALASSRDRLLDLAGPLPAARRLVWSLPSRLQPSAAHTAWTIALDPDGTVAHDLQESGGPYRMVTGVREHDGRLWFSSLEGTGIAFASVPR